MILLFFFFKKQNAYDREERFENCESSTSLCGSFSPWLAFDYVSVSVIFYAFSTMDKRISNTHSADSMNSVKSDKLPLSEIYKTSNPKC